LPFITFDTTKIGFNYHRKITEKLNFADSEILMLKSHSRDKKSFV